MSLTTINSGGVKDDSIVNADIKSDAAIAGTKVAPDFGSQNLVTTGNVGVGISPTKKLTVFGTGAGEATLQIEGEGGADPYINFLANNAQHWSLGVDDSDSDKFKVSEHSALGTNDYLVVDTSGNVGIKTASPTNNLHLGASGADQKRSIRIDGTNGSSEIQGVVLESDGENAKFNIKTAAGGGTPSDKFTINAISGNCGIGTVSPSTLLHIDSDSSDTTLTIESDLDGSSLFTSGIDFKREGTSKGSRIQSFRNASAGGVGLNFLTTADNTAEVNGTLTSRLCIDASGRANFEGNGSDYIVVDIHNTGSGVGSQMRFRNDHAGSPYIGIANDTSGDFILYSEGHIKVKHGGDLAIQAAPNNSLTLYYDDSKKFETTSYGAKVTGRAEVRANVSADYAFQVYNDGASFNRYGVLIQCGQDSPVSTNYALGVADGDGTTQGYLTFTGGTLSLVAFTASHPCIIPDADNPSDSSMAYPYGTLLETISIQYSKNKKDGSDTERGIRYKVQKTQSANSRKVLGAYAGSMNGGPEGQTNEHDVYVLGDGHILVNNAGGNIEVGDGICSSATAGIGQKATANPSMIIGIAQEAITFTGSETKLVAVQYGLQQFIPWT